MEEREIFKMKAEAEAKHVLAKLNETEAKYIEEMAKLESKVAQIQDEYESSKTRRLNLEEKLSKLQSAKDPAFKKASEEFVETMESLQPKGVFQKTGEIYQSVVNAAGGLKDGIKEKAAKW